MKETITIKNFGGLKNVTIPLNSINIFIGKQASGKSVTAKLIYFFRKTFEDIFDGIIRDVPLKNINDNVEKRFKRYFPIDSWSNSKFFVQYNSGEIEFNSDDKKHVFEYGGITIQRKGKNNIKIDFKKLYSEIAFTISELSRSLEENVKNKHIFEQFKDTPEEALKAFVYVRLGKFFKPMGMQLFIPAGRSFFFSIKNAIFSLLSEDISIDPFLMEFGRVYEKFKDYKGEGNYDESIKYIQDALSEIAGAEFVCDETGDYFIHKDGRRINLLFCSSGQQEVLPLAIILKNYIGSFRALDATSTTLYIEEPEAHLFPSAQKKVIEMIAIAHNLSKEKSQMVITTHSPYILTSFNNLLQAGHLLENGANKKKLFKIVPEFEVLKPGELNAYAFENGDVTSLIDEETGLISADMLDRVSEEIAVQFEELLDL